MLPLVEVTKKNLDDYRTVVTAEIIDEIKKLAKNLQGLKIFHVNSTPRGGGVAEILKSLVPLMQAVGLAAEWYTIPPRDNFFVITKKMHNALQGKKYKFPLKDRKTYLWHISKTAKLMTDMKPDVWLIHDPQPAGICLFLPEFKNALLRLHIDITEPNKEIWKFLSSFFPCYQKIIVSSPAYLKKEIKEKGIVIPPAIDPLVEKNQTLPLEKAKEILESCGLNPNKPLIAQIARFDPWKDPIGVVSAYKLAKKKIKDLQLALVGFLIARDDPEAEKIYLKVKKKVDNDPDVFLFSEVEKLGSLKIDTFVNAIQTAADVILQMSIKEGFGLSVTEAMWKGKAVVARKAAGLQMQIKDGQDGFLVNTPKEAAEKIIYLIENPDLAQEIGQKAKDTVRKNFLLPRLLRDYLKLLNTLV